MSKISINKYIVADSGICHGKPTFKGSRVMVWQVLEMLEAGVNEGAIIKAFPSLTKRHIRAALSYAADLVRGENNVLLRV